MGAALGYWYNELKMKRSNKNIDSMKCSYLGPEYTNEKIKDILTDIGAKFETFENDNLLDFTTDKLAEGKAVGWFQNKMEFGPRALGSRSILGDARSPDMQKKLNLKVKFRESFRPFAPAILHEDLNEWFDLDSEEPLHVISWKS